MDYKQWGEGPAVVLMPGLGCDDRLWFGVIEKMASDFTLIVPEIWQAGTIMEAAEGVAALIDGLESERIGVAGLSMGGYVTFELVCWTQARVDCCAFLDTTCFSDTQEKRALRDQTIRLIETGNYKQVLRLYANSVLSPDNRDGELYELMVEMGVSLGGDTFSRSVKAIRDRKSYEEAIQNIKLPSLFISGEHDEMTPPELATQMSKMVPLAYEVTILGAGHMSVLENPADVALTLGTFFKDNLSEQK